MKLTALLRMKKPEGGDAVNVEDLNDNFDILDEAIRLLEEFQGDVSNGIVHMDQASTRTNVANGDSLAVLFGKVMRWFADLKSGAFAETANNDSTKDEGYVADARIVRTHGLEIDAIDNRVKTLETSFPGGCKVIAQAITAEGVTTAETASPSTMAANIAKIRNGGNLKETKYVPTGYTWFAGKQAYSGTGSDKGEVTLKPTGNNTATSGAGYYTKVIADGTAAYSAGYSAGNTAGVNATKKGNATKANVRNGYTFTSESAGVNQAGNMKELTGNARPSVAVTSASQNVVFSEAGYCDGVKVDSSAVYNSGVSAGKDAVTLHRVKVGDVVGSETTKSKSFSFTVPNVELTADNFFLVPSKITARCWPWSGSYLDHHDMDLNTVITYTGGTVTVNAIYGEGTGLDCYISSATLWCVYTKPRRAFTSTK